MAGPQLDHRAGAGGPGAGGLRERAVIACSTSLRGLTDLNVVPCLLIGFACQQCTARRSCKKLRDSAMKTLAIFGTAAALLGAMAINAAAAYPETLISDFNTFFENELYASWNLPTAVIDSGPDSYSVT